MLRSLYSAVSGLQANQTEIDTIGNNLANVNTVGFKSSDVQFESLLSQTLADASGGAENTDNIGGINPSQVGLGVAVAGIATNFTEGSAEETGNPLDMSIQGNGFFILQSGSSTSYTRAGSFQLDSNGYIVNPSGSLVQGWSATNGVVNSGTSTTSLQIPTDATLPAQATSQVTLGGNIAMNGSNDPVTSVTVYNKLGTPSTLTLQFAQGSFPVVPATSPPTTYTTWGVAASDGATGSGGALTYGTAVPLSFNSSGESTGSTVSVTDNAGNTYTLNVGSITAAAGQSSITPSSQNGYQSGALQSFAVSANGTITGTFSNGQNQVLGQIATATFTNPSGLSSAGDTNFTATSNSGIPEVGTAGTGSAGILAPGTLEMSNVDLGQEFTNLIQAQSGFEANSKMITTDNEILSDLINMKQ